MRGVRNFKFKMNLAKSDWNFGRLVERIKNKFSNNLILGSYFKPTMEIEIYLKEHYILHKEQKELEDRIITTIEHEAIHHCLEKIDDNINNEYNVKYIQWAIKMPSMVPITVINKLLNIAFKGMIK